MNDHFIEKLDIKNLLWLIKTAEDSLLKKDANDILEYIKKLEKQKDNVTNQKDYDQINKEIALLDHVANFYCI